LTDSQRGPERKAPATPGDEDHSVAEAYGVWVEKSMYGRKYMGMERTTFVISPEGTIKDVFRNVKPAEHDELVLGALGVS
jgi:thioredoxin-dependent peroxiredoxin